MKITKMNKEYIIFEIESQSRNLKHEVIFNRLTGEWSCTCEDYWYRKRACKHTNIAKEFLQDLLIELCYGNDVYIGETLNNQQKAQI